MKKSLLVFILLIGIIQINLNAQTTVGGIISENTVWTLTNSPYIITDGIVILENVSLTIEAGVNVCLDGNYSILVNGELIALGSKENKIVFTSNQIIKNKGDWGGIRFTNTSVDAQFDSNGDYINGSLLNNCIVEYAGSDDIRSVYLDQAKPFIYQCIFRNNNGYAIQLSNNITNYEIKNNIFANNSACISKFSNYTFANIIIENNVFINNAISNQYSLFDFFFCNLTFCFSSYNFNGFISVL